MPRIILPALFLLAAIGVPATSQEAPSDTTEEQKAYATYESLFDDFDDERQALLTKWDRLREKQNVKPEEIKQIEDELKALDVKYSNALEAYIQGHPTANDVMPARFELAIALSRVDDKLERAVEVCDEFLKHHEDTELAGDILFLKGQTLFRIEGREDEALEALDAFLDKHPNRQDSDAARMMRIRTLMFVDKISEAKRALDALLKLDHVKDDEEAMAHLEALKYSLGWVGRELPDFKRPDLKGETRSAESLKGKTSLLFVWDSNSGACLGELPFVQEAFKKHGDKINFLSISVNESKPALEQWLERNPDAVKFPTIWIDREEENSVLKKLDVSLIPFLILVDASGKVYRYDVRSDDMLRYVAKLAGE